MTDTEPEPTDEERATRILDDRRRVSFETHACGFVDLEVATSALEPGCVAVQMNRGDPVLLGHRIDDLRRLLDDVQQGTVTFPVTPAPCPDCGETEHTIETCERAEWDPTTS